MAGLLAAGLLAYCLAMGVQQAKSADQRAALTDQAQELTTAIQRHAARRAALEEELSSTTPETARAPDPATELTPTTFLTHLTSAAQESGVALSSVLVGEATLVGDKEAPYQTLPVTATLRGSMANLQLMLSRLSEGTSTMAVSSIRVAQLEGLPSSEVRLLFYLSRPVAEEGAVR